jgi:hypothetical protein
MRKNNQPTTTTTLLDSDHSGIFAQIKWKVNFQPASSIKDEQPRTKTNYRATRKYNNL